MIVAGIMSGTSLDGIDVALVEIKGKRIETLAFHTVSYPSAVRAALLAVSNSATHTRDIARLHFLLPELYAAAFKACCKSARIDPATIALIGCHGQTIYHEGTKTELLGHQVASSLQLGDGNILAARTACPVVSDFRPADLAAGGKGAPLVPYVDFLLFHHATRSRVALNIGGIANITWLPAGAPPEKTIAFDTGPGNMVVDQLIVHYTNGEKCFDQSGEMAADGLAHPDLVAAILRDPYYSEKPPKTAGREQYGAEFLARLLAFDLSPADTVATATYLTAATIADGITRFAGGEDDPPAEVIVSGGGAQNKTLLRFLRAELPETEVVRSEIHGIDPDAKEAIAFAILAHETWHKRPSNLPSATGAKHPAILGKLSLP